MNHWSNVVQLGMKRETPGMQTGLGSEVARSQSAAVHGARGTMQAVTIYAHGMLCTVPCTYMHGVTCACTLYVHVHVHAPRCCRTLLPIYTYTCGTHVGHGTPQNHPKQAHLLYGFNSKEALLVLLTRAYWYASYLRYHFTQSIGYSLRRLCFSFTSPRAPPPSAIKHAPGAPLAHPQGWSKREGDIFAIRCS